MMKESVILSVNSQTGVYFLNTKEIFYLEASGVYCVIHRADGTQQIVSKPLGDFIQSLPANFRRVHRSFCVNLQHVEKRLSGEGVELLLNNGVKVPVSRQHRKDLDEILKNFLN